VVSTSNFPKNKKRDVVLVFPFQQNPLDLNTITVTIKYCSPTSNATPNSNLTAANASSAYYSPEIIRYLLEKQVKGKE
jgi:hypothetical protein